MRNEESVVKQVLMKVIKKIDPSLADETVQKLADGLHAHHYAPSSGIGSQTEYLASSR
jgi:hypothetical protein